MSEAKTRDFECPVVMETVKIQLRRRRSVGLNKADGYIVQCDQLECQYATENRPPCPLHESMFAEEITELEEKRRRRRQGQ